MLRITAKQQLMALTSLATGITVAVTTLIIIPSVKSILALEKNINQTQKTLEQQYQKTQRLRRSIHELDPVLKQTEKFKQAFLESGGELSLITRLEELAAKHQVEQDLNALPAAETAAATQQLPPYFVFSFFNQGAFADLVSYLNALEQLTPYLIIDHLRWEKGQRGPDSRAPVTLRFDAKVYSAHK